MPVKSSLSPEEALANLRKKNAERQKRYYDKNTAKVLLDRKIKRAIKSGKTVVATQQEAQEEEQEQPITPPTPIKEKQTTQSKLKITKVTFETLTNALKDKITTPATLKTYMGSLNRLKNIIPDCPNVVECLNQHKKIITAMNTATKSNGEKYSTNSIKADYQFILYLIDHVKLSLKKPATDAYRKEFDVYNNQSILKQQQKNNEEVLMPLAQFLALVEKYYTPKDWFYIFVKLYTYFPSRDNFALHYITNKNMAKDNTKNYIVIPRSSNGNIVVIFNNYKTAKIHGKYEKTLPDKTLQTQIKNFVKSNVKEGELLFGSSAKLSAKIANEIRKKDKLNLQNITLSTLRRMVSTNAKIDINDLDSFRKAYDLAIDQQHTLKTAIQVYKSKL
jgi:hypothetical protein